MALCNRVHEACLLSTDPPQEGECMCPPLDLALLQQLWAEFDNDVHGSLDTPTQYEYKLGVTCDVFDLY